MAVKPQKETRTLCYPKDLCDPKDWLNFLQLDPFPPAWKRLGLNDDELRALEIAIMVNPTRAPVVKGTGGLRKLRCVPDGWKAGKSSGIRVCYVYFKRYGLVALVTAYRKREKDDLTEEEKKVIQSLIREIQEYLETGPKRE